MLLVIDVGNTNITFGFFSILQAKNKNTDSIKIKIR